LYNQGAADDIIKGKIGEHEFCVDCEKHEICKSKDKLPKVLRCCTIAIEFYFANQNYKNYVWDGNYMEQPLWLMEMSSIVGKIKAEIDKEKANNGK